MGFGMNVTYLKDVRSVQAAAIHQPTLLAVTPRYDARWLSLAVPHGLPERGVYGWGIGSRRSGLAGYR